MYVLRFHHQSYANAFIFALMRTFPASALAIEHVLTFDKL